MVRAFFYMDEAANLRNVYKNDSNGLTVCGILKKRLGKEHSCASYREQGGKTSGGRKSNVY